tara:strand:+ start:2380 stop:2973 length:594 start_codon:yes stop_codon:yes gene_type:complete
MIRIGILGDIGSGKSFVAESFGFPVFNADREVAKLYNKDKKIFRKLKKKLPKYFDVFPINKKQVSYAILDKKDNLKKIIRIIHPEIKKNMSNFLRKNKRKRIVILDVPLLLENKINEKSDILIFVSAKKNHILKRLKKRKNFDQKLFKKFKKIQLPLDYKKSKSEFIIKNDFTKRTVLRYVKKIVYKIKNERNSFRY